MDGRIAYMVALLQRRCPHFSPNIVPAYLQLSSLEDVCASKQFRRQLRKWIEDKEIQMELVLSSRVDFASRKIVVDAIVPSSELDTSLRSVEAIMMMLVGGHANALQMATDRFLELNGYSDLSALDGKLLFQEVYTTAYAIQVALRCAYILHAWAAHSDVS